MAELNFKKLADAPVLEEVPDGAKVYAEVDGKVYRVAGDNLGGGGIPTAIFHLVTETAEEKATRANDAPTFTATCDNMTFAECLALFEAGKSVDARLVADADYYLGKAHEDAPSLSGGMFSYGDLTIIGFTFKSTFCGDSLYYWLPDGTITTDMSAIGGG